MAPAPRENHPEPSSPPSLSAGSDTAFYAGLIVLGGFYVALILAMLTADFYYAYTHRENLLTRLLTDEIRYSIKLSLITCSITTILSIWVAVPIGYLMSRWEFRGKALVDAILDIPIVLPPLVVGLSLLLLFRQTFLRELDNVLPIAFHVPAVILAQFSVACAFAVRALRQTFDDIPHRREQVALTLGCTRAQAFWRVVLPESRSGLLTAATLAWARSLGEFGPILVFAGSTRKHTEVLPVSVHLELSVGNLEGAVALSLLMVIVAMFVLVLVRTLGGRRALARV